MAAEHDLTEGRVAAELGLDRLELYLAAAELQAGRFDPLTHLRVFTEEEVKRLAQRLGVKRRRISELTDAQRGNIPEPASE